MTADGLIAKESFTRTMCTATNSAIPTAPIREEWHTRLTTPRRVGAGGPTGCEKSHAPPARRRRALHPVPEVARVPLCPRRPRGEPTPRRFRRTRGQRTDACAACQAAARPAPSAGGRAGPAVPASAASCVASVAARLYRSQILRL